MTMKKTFILAFVATLALGTQAAERTDRSANDTLVVTTTPQMHCSGCEQKIKSNLRFVKGTKKIETSVPDQTVTIVYNPKKASPEAYVEAFRKIGYEVKPLK